MVNIRENITSYLSKAGPMDRLASFDYCYNYFQTFKEEDNVLELASPKNIQMSCLQLGFYLASWGMFRSSGQISKKSLKIYESLIQGIAAFDRNIWYIDVDSYSEDSNMKLLFDCTWMIDETLGINNEFNIFRPSLTLITKIMLGVFGNIPAFDTFFVRSSGLRRINQDSLMEIANFYYKNKTQIDEYDIRTKDFHTSESTHRRYTKAKIIDMIWFIEGQKKY